MKTNISIIFFDKKKEKHDYETLSQELTLVNDTFDVVVYDDTNDILKKLNDNRGFDVIITVGNNLDMSNIESLPDKFKKRVTHVDKFDFMWIRKAIYEKLAENIIPSKNGISLFSVFTPTYNTGKERLTRLYNSLTAQTHTNWDWFIIDDSTTPETQEILNSFNDPRIFVFKNVTNHGNIGFNKHMAAMMADGDYLVEVDHDDELVPECFEYLDKAFKKTNADFMYSNALELNYGQVIMYGDYFALGQGVNKTDTVNGVEYTFPDCSPSINPKSIRTIYTQPNHVRVWEKNFYHRICGHNTDLSVLDDMEILIRTFLYGKMGKIDKILYIQHEDGRGSENGTTQSKRFCEIQRTTWVLYRMYDKLIHDRIIELGFKDTVWDENTKSSKLRTNPELPVMNDIY